MRPTRRADDKEGNEAREAAYDHEGRQHPKARAFAFHARDAGEKSKPDAQEQAGEIAKMAVEVGGRSRPKNVDAEEYARETGAYRNEA